MIYRSKFNGKSGVLFRCGWILRFPYTVNVCLFCFVGLHVPVLAKYVVRRSLSANISSFFYFNVIDIFQRVFKFNYKDLCKCIFLFNFRYCITEANMTKFGLHQEWKVLTVNKDETGFEFISSVEMISYPIVGVQFHPEKNAYEWKNSENNPYSYGAVYSARYFYDWLTNKARISIHSFQTPEKEQDNLIHNYVPSFIAKSGYIFDEVYLFNEQN